VPTHSKALAPAAVPASDSNPSHGATKKTQRGVERGRKYRWGRRISLLLVLAVVPALAADPDTSVPKSQTSEQEGYLHHVFAGPGPFLKSAAGAGISQAKGTPHEWGGGMKGYARRLGSGFGKHIVKSSIRYGVGRLRHEELHYRPSGREGFTPRLKYALVSTVITRKTTTGNRTVAVGEISSVIGSGLISRLWQPASVHTVASGFGSAGISFGADAAYNVVREVWPEIRHPRRSKNKKQDEASNTGAALQTEVHGNEQAR